MLRQSATRTVVLQPERSSTVVQPPVADTETVTPEKVARKTRPPPLKSKTKSTVPKRIGRSMYVATASDGKLGIIDQNKSISGNSLLLVHVPKKHNSLILDLHVGDTLVMTKVRYGAEPCEFPIAFVGRSQYFSPGKRVSSCVVGVDTRGWKDFTETKMRKNQRTSSSGKMVSSSALDASPNSIIQQASSMRS